MLLKVRFTLGLPSKALALQAFFAYLTAAATVALTDLFTPLVSPDELVERRRSIRVAIAVNHEVAIYRDRRGEPVNPVPRRLRCRGSPRAAAVGPRLPPRCPRCHRGLAERRCRWKRATYARRSRSIGRTDRIARAPAGAIHEEMRAAFGSNR